MTDKPADKPTNKTADLKAYMAEWRSANRDNLKAYHKRHNAKRSKTTWKRANPDKVKARRAYQAKWKREDRERYKAGFKAVPKDIGSDIGAFLFAELRLHQAEERRKRLAAISAKGVAARARLKQSWKDKLP